MCMRVPGALLTGHVDQYCKCARKPAVLPNTWDPLAAAAIVGWPMWAGHKGPDHTNVCIIAVILSSVVTSGQVVQVIMSTQPHS